MSLTIKDLEQVQAEHPEGRLELVKGSIIAMGPHDYISDEIGTEFARLLGNWVKPRKLGRVTGSSPGFILPNYRLTRTRRFICSGRKSQAQSARLC